MSVTAETTLQFFADSGSLPRPFRAGVSLHSHTMFSEESLSVVPNYTAKVPLLDRAVLRQQAEYSQRKGQTFDFKDAFWTPPLGPRQAYRLEEKQIQRRFDLPALVSLTDHDDTRAALLLRVIDRFRNAPVSTEWTVPFGSTFFHVGAHNLPAEHARDMQAELAEFTRRPSPELLRPHLAKLSSFPDLLLVLNHPLWDEKGIGAEAHRQTLYQLVREHGRYLHALELNGLRAHKENLEVLALAREADLPAVAGGDRHGREPNALLNLSRAASFAGFVEEVRRARRSHVVFMPQYREPLKLRILRTIVDVVAHYPENIPGRRHWSDRIYYRNPASRQPVPMSVMWQDGGPRIVQHFIAAAKLLRWRGGFAQPDAEHAD